MPREKEAFAVTALILVALMIGCTYTGLNQTAADEEISKQHVAAAKRLLAMAPSQPVLEAAEEHLRAVPPGSSQYAEAQGLLKEVSQKLQILRAARDHGTPQPPAAGGRARPAVPPPKFRVYRQDPKQGIISVLVQRTVTAEQLRSLLWFFRENIRAGRFRELGLRKFDEGGIVGFYRGEKCANEEFIDKLGPCGYGEHDDAEYQWGLEGNLSKDVGSLVSKDRAIEQVFDYSDNWQPAVANQAVPEVNAQALKQQRDDFAVQLSLSFKEQGLDMMAYPDEDTLAVKSDEFRDIGVREQFLQTFPSNRAFRKSLCALRFRDVYAYYSKGLLSGEVGRRVAINCR